MIYGSAYTTARYIKANHPDVTKVRVVGMKSISKELAEVGIGSCGAEENEGFVGDRVMSLDEFEAYKLDPEVTAVVVGLDSNFNYAKLCIASLYIQAGAKFIATNDDAYDMVNGRRLPGAGAMVQSIRYSLGQVQDEKDSHSARYEPAIIGKPNPYVIDLI